MNLKNATVKYDCGHLRETLVDPEEWRDVPIDQVRDSRGRVTQEFYRDHCLCPSCATARQLAADLEERDPVVEYEEREARIAFQRGEWVNDDLSI